MNRLLQALLSVLLAALAHGEAAQELPSPVQVECPPGSVQLRWTSSPGAIYQVERAESLDSGWQPAGDPLTGDGGPATFTEPRASVRKFYRIAVTPFDFNPADLAPKWQLDAETDFAGAPDGPVDRWTGSGISSLVQASASERPLLAGGAVSFDGAGDYLSFPMWTGGVGSEWTFAALFKIRQSVQDLHSFFGGDIAANRVLDFSYLNTGLNGLLPGVASILSQDEAAAAPNDNWRVMVIRCSGSTLKVHFDWYDGEVQGQPRSTLGGNFNVGCGYSPSTSSAPMTLRYAAFFPSCLPDDATGKMLTWLERKKRGEYPPVTVIYGGGQSNYLGCTETLRQQLPAALGNVSLAFGRHYGSSALNLWMNDTADLSGFEVCPFYDLSAAPANSKAGFIGANHSGTHVLESWHLRTKHLVPHTQVRRVCLFIQGETDNTDSTQLWRPNGDGGWNLTYSDHYWLADTYGPRSTAWNAAIRQSMGDGNLVFIYERVAYSPGYLDYGQEQALFRQRASQLAAVAVEPRYLLVDTSEFPRPDGVHFSSPKYQPGEVPNSGTERFCRATVRLINASERLASMSSDARLLAMRAIDSGYLLDEAKLQACEALAAAPGFGFLRSLVIPSLTADNAVDQERLRRCNLLVHLGGIENSVSFLPAAPSGPVATYLASPVPITLRRALAAFLEAWGIPGTVTISTPP